MPKCVVAGEINGQGSTSQQQGKEEAEAVEEADCAGGAFRFDAEQAPAARQVAWPMAAVRGRAPRGLRRVAGEMDAIAATRQWLERAVIGLNLCPFARAVHVKEQIRWVESPARDAEGLLGDLVSELRFLAGADPGRVETTLLIHPHALADFLDYNDFLDVADAAIEELGLAGVLQVASFHPDYRFAGTAPDDVENLSNRSPHPMLHLLREDSVARAVAAYPDTAAIYERNIETLRRLGHEGWHRLISQVIR